MLHEIKEILQQGYANQKQGMKTVLASVVELDGSSYRRPGVRMSIREDGLMIGAVSGGCVEKEIIRQAASVFEDAKPKLMVYDGRYRLGCEGVLYILIEPLVISDEFLEAFTAQWKLREPFQIQSFYSKEEKGRFLGGSIFHLKNKDYSLKNASQPTSSLQVFKQTLKPGLRLVIIGSEHDAVELCKFAAQAGWEVHLVAPPDDPKSIENFPGAMAYHGISELEFEDFELDSQTAVVLMTHSYVQDLKYMSCLINKKVAYLGLLGPASRREKLFAQLLEYNPNTPEEFLLAWRGPSGINIGAETPQEIAISVIAEILSVVRKQIPIPLKEKEGRIHQ